MKSSLPREFIFALLSGEIQNKFLYFSLGKIGLQHVMAISGFHFGLIAAFFLFFLKHLPFKTRNIALLVLINLYFLFIGPSPSIQRAYLTIELLLIGQLISKRALSINALGLCMLIELLFHPLHITHLGFQFSYLSCFSLLINYPLVDTFFRRFIKDRPKKTYLSLPFYQKAGCFLAILLRKAFALSLAVFLLLSPVLLFYFHKFPLASLLYNLFIPSFVAVLCFFLLTFFPLAMIFSLFTTIFLSFFSKITQFLLNFILYPPPSFLLYLRGSLNLWQLFSILFMIFSISLLLQRKIKFTSSFFGI